MQVMADGMMKCKSFKKLGYRENALDLNSRLPPGLIISDERRNWLDESIRLDLDCTGSTCTACTHHFKADSNTGCVITCIF